MDPEPCRSVLPLTLTFHVILFEVAAESLTLGVVLCKAMTLLLAFGVVLRKAMTLVLAFRVLGLQATHLLLAFGVLRLADLLVRHFRPLSGWEPFFRTHFPPGYSRLQPFMTVG